MCFHSRNHHFLPFGNQILRRELIFIFRLTYFPIWPKVPYVQSNTIASQNSIIQNKKMVLIHIFTVAEKQINIPVLIQAINKSSVVSHPQPSTLPPKGKKIIRYSWKQKFLYGKNYWGKKVPEGRKDSIQKLVTAHSGGNVFARK